MSQLRLFVVRALVGPILLIGGILVGLSCSGPAAEAPEAETASRDYHVQLDRTKKKAKANRMLGRALEWWREEASTVRSRPMATESSPVSVVWQAPLYRVRLGPFATREEADSVLTVAREAFPEAFVRPERVSSRR